MGTDSGASRARLRCYDIARAVLGPPQKKAGAELLWRCTEHDDHDPSLSVNPKKNCFGCFVCGVTGGPWKLAAFLSRLDLKDKAGITHWLVERGLMPSSRSSRASRAEAGKTGVGGGDIPLDKNATPQQFSGLTLEEYAKAKRLPAAFLRRLGLSTIYMSGQPCVRIPYRRPDGLDAVRFRLAIEGEDRFRWKSGIKPCLYGLERIPEAEAQGYVCLVEGESDCHTLCYHGFPVLALPGASSWQEEWSQILEKIRQIYIVIESDKGGEAVLKWLRVSKVRERTRLVRLQNAKDPSALHLIDPQAFAGAWKKALAESMPWSDFARIEFETKSHAKWQKCAGLAVSESLLDRMSATMRRLHVAGEEKTVKLIYLAVTSRLLSKPLSVAVKGPSAAGKSYTLEQTLRLFPASAYYALSAMSERALAYSEEPLAHRMLVVYEAAGLSNEFGSYLVRSFLSEGRLRYETVEKTSKGIRPRLIERQGPTGLIVTTTEVRLHPENETRILSITVDDSPRQTQEVLSALADDGENGGGDRLIPEEWQALQEWLELAEHRITIPYAKELARLIPPVAVRLRRDFSSILTLVRAHALLHQATRERDASGRIVATLADYRVVRDLVSKLVSEGIERTVSDAVRETVVAVEDLCTEQPASCPVSISWLATHLGLDRSTVSRRVTQALQRGYLTNAEDRRGKPAKLTIGDPMPSEVELLPAPEELKRCSVADESDR